MRIIIAGLMACLSMAACNARESQQTGGRYATDSTQLIAKGKALATRNGQDNCLPWKDLRNMEEGDLLALQAYLKAGEPPTRR